MSDISKKRTRARASKPRATNPAARAGPIAAAPEYLTAVQAAQMTGFTPKALESMRSRCEGPPFLRVGRSIRYRAADVRAWMEKGGVSS